MPKQTPEQSPLPLPGFEEAGETTVPPETVPTFDSAANSAAIAAATQGRQMYSSRHDATAAWLNERGDSTRDYTRLKNPPKPPAEILPPRPPLSARALAAEGGLDYQRAIEESGHHDDNPSLNGIPLTH